MTTPLPNQGDLTMPITFTRTPNKQTMGTGSYQVSTTVGQKPWVDTVTFNWVVDQTKASAMFELFESEFLNGLYSYTHNTRGEMILRCNGDMSSAETHDGLLTAFQASFTRVR